MSLQTIRFLCISTRINRLKEMNRNTLMKTHLMLDCAMAFFSESKRKYFFRCKKGLEIRLGGRWNNLCGWLGWRVIAMNSIYRIAASGICLCNTQWTVAKLKRLIQNIRWCYSPAGKLEPILCNDDESIVLRAVLFQTYWKVFWKSYQSKDNIPVLKVDVWGIVLNEIGVRCWNGAGHAKLPQKCFLMPRKCSLDVVTKLFLFSCHKIFFLPGRNSCTKQKDSCGKKKIVFFTK